MRQFMLLLALCWYSTRLGAEAFHINHYDVKLSLNRDAILEVTETIDLEFTEDRHGILRKIPFRFFIEGIPESARAKRLIEGTTHNEIFLKNITVEGWPCETYKEGDYWVLRIGDPDEKVSGEQRYVIKYTVYNAINFFQDHSELYWNLIGNEWDTHIQEASFRLEWPESLPKEFLPQYFAATGSYGSTSSNAELTLDPGRRFLQGKIQAPLMSNEGFTVGMSFPLNFIRATPIPISILADKYYIKDLHTDISVGNDGVSEVTERYTLVPAVQLPSWRRFFVPKTFGGLRSRDWLGGGYAYLLTDLKAEDGPTCNQSSERQICFDLSQTPPEQEITAALSYRLYGNWTKRGEDGRLYFQYPGGRLDNEPVVRSSLRIALPDDLTADFTANITDEYEQILPDDVTVNRYRNNIFEVAYDARLLKPGEALTFELSLAPGSLPGTVSALERSLWWRNNKWLFLPVLLFAFLYLIWDRWGRDEHHSTAVQYYPPKDLPPSEAGILIDDFLHDRDLLALIPYWGANGFIEITELEKKFLTAQDFHFKVLKPLPNDRPDYEKTMWRGFFGSNAEAGDFQTLSNLKNKFYTSFNQARKELNKNIRQRAYYMPHTRGAATALMILGGVIIGVGILAFVVGRLGWELTFASELGVGLALGGILFIIFGRIMPKKAPVGLEAYRQLDGFRLFVKDAELPRLETFLKEDPHYFDKTLPYAIVFDLAEKWAEKFNSLTIEPPNWYHTYGNRPFSPMLFTHDLSKSMQSMGNTMVSTPKSSGSSGGSFGGGGFSGGGFGGGGGSSW